MAIEVHKKKLAEEDLIGIWLYTYANFGEKQADMYLDELEAAMLNIADQPLASRERSELNSPVRIHLQSHHLIVYVLGYNRIDVVRVLHRSMDISDHL